MTEGKIHISRSYFQDMGSPIITCTTLSAALLQLTAQQLLLWQLSNWDVHCKVAKRCWKRGANYKWALNATGSTVPHLPMQHFSTQLQLRVVLREANYHAGQIKQCPYVSHHDVSLDPKSPCATLLWDLATLSGAHSVVHLLTCHIPFFSVKREFTVVNVQPCHISYPKYPSWMWTDTYLC